MPESQEVTSEVSLGGLAAPMKRCNKCGETKILGEFYSDKRALDGKQGICKGCFSERAKIHNQKPEVRAKARTYKQLPEVKVRDKARLQTLEVKARTKAIQKKYNSKPEVKAREKERAQAPEAKAREKKRKQKPETKAHRNKRDKERRANDLTFRLAGDIRSRGRLAIRNGQKAGSFVRDLGCSIDFLIAYLEAHFNPGMTWGNWGKGPGKWHIDHIVPLAWFDLTNREQFLSACNYTNLQPLWEEENLKKGSKVQWQF